MKPHRKGKRAQQKVSMPLGVAPPADYGQIRKYVTITCLVLALYQVAIGSDGENIFAAVSTCAGSIFALYKFFTLRNMKYFPLSSWMVLLFVLANETGPLVVKSIEFEPLTYNLKQPVTTFAYSLAGTVTLMASHWLYTNARATR
jgi:hypothetical protein